VATVTRRVGDLLVKSKVGTKRQDDHFRASDTPLHEVTVENRTGEEVYVEVEIATESPILVIDGAAPPWRTSRIKHGGLRSRGKREWPHRATLSFTGAQPNRPQIMQIKIYMAASWWPDDEPLPLLDDIPHAIWIK
jgi:hypothetical protein